MRILLTNDDGVYAHGLKVLQAALRQRTQHEVYMIAPERERSAIGHSITLHKPLQVRKLDMGTDVVTWSVNGTPADCVKIGALMLMPALPDLVLSGINRGANVGIDVLYSGTVSAAIEGWILGLPSIAVSLASIEDGHYETAAELIVSLIEMLKETPLPGTLLNVNVPDVPWSGLTGIEATRLGKRSFKDAFIPNVDPRGRTYYWLTGAPVEITDEPGTDSFAIRHNVASITPIRLALTDEAQMETIAGLAAVLYRNGAQPQLPT